MRYRLMLSLLLFSFLSLFSACDPTVVIADPDASQLDCGYDLPTVVFSDGRCEPNFADLAFGPLLLNPRQPVPGMNPDKMAPLPANCAGSEGSVRQAQLQHKGVDRFELHVYPGVYGAAVVQVFGAQNCDQKITALTQCVTVDGIFGTIPVDRAGKYSHLYVQVTAIGRNGDDHKPRAGDFVSVAMFRDVAPLKKVPYGGIDVDNNITQITRSCDGVNWQRLVFSTCNPKDDLDAWADDAGLDRNNRERYDGPGGRLLVVNVDDKANVRKSSTTTRRKKLDANNDDTHVTEDHILTVPDPNSPGLIDFNDIQNQPANVRKCMTFQPGTASTRDRKSQVLITHIDSGVELNGNWDKAWDRHNVRFPVRERFAQTNSLGYDYWNGDFRPDDETGHGTNTAGALIGNYSGKAPLTVHHAKIFGKDGASFFGALVALHAAVDLGSQVINCSWGDVSQNPEPAMTCAVEYAERNNVLIVASAGNDRTNINVGKAPQWPASYSTKFKNVITVTSYQYQRPDLSAPLETSPDFANYGDPTVSVAAYLTAMTPRYQGSDFNYLAGTSISAPLITAELATAYGNTGDARNYAGALRRDGGLRGRVLGTLYLPVCR